MSRRTLIALSLAVAMLLLVPATSLAGNGLRFFRTTDGNISCGMVKPVKKNKKKHRSRLPGEARCDVKNHTWLAPPKPSFCDLDWGFGVAVGDKGFGDYVCAGDTVADATKSFVLAPGTTVVVGRSSCATPPADANAVRCTNSLSGHGFEVSAAAVQLF